MNSEQMAVAAENRRVVDRQPSELYACLLSLDGYGVVRCQTKDLSDSGIFVSAPIGFGLAVGQQYEVLLSDSAADLLHPLQMGQGVRATIVRAELEMGPDGHRIGVGLRFEQPYALSAIPVATHA